MSYLRIPIPEVNGHPDNERINWQLRLPPYVDQNQLTVDLSAIAGVADSGDIAKVYVLPADRPRLTALADSGFDSGLPTVSGVEIAELAMRADGKRYFPIGDTIDAETGRHLTHVGLRIPLRPILEELREVSAETSPLLWAQYLNKDVGTSLGYAAFGSVFREPFKHVRPDVLAPARLALRALTMLGAQAKHAEVVRYLPPVPIEL